MNIKFLAYLLVFLLPAAAARSEEGKVTILAPEAGAVLTGTGAHQLQYNVAPGPNGEHIHVYVDDKEVGVLRTLKGSYPLEGLASGARTICIKVVNKAHTPVGVDGCVKVNVSSASDAKMQAPPKPVSDGY